MRLISFLFILCKSHFIYHPRYKRWLQRKCQNYAACLQKWPHKSGRFAMRPYFNERWPHFPKVIQSSKRWWCVYKKVMRECRKVNECDRWVSKGSKGDIRCQKVKLQGERWRHVGKKVTSPSKLFCSKGDPLTFTYNQFAPPRGHDLQTSV